MLRHLVIRRFAVIDDLEIDFSPGFTAITGETGAGKSILIDALGLLLGDRAEPGLIADDSEQAELEAVFRLDDAHPASDWLRQQALAEDEELILRRILSRSSSSRAWINGRSATIGQLAELGELLVEIHGQHEHQQLGSSATQRQLLDRQVDTAITTAVAQAYDRWLAARDELAAFEADSSDPEQLELLRYQHRELQALNLRAGEYGELEAEQERLSRIDEIRQAASTAAAALDQIDDPAARTMIQQALSSLSGTRSLDRRIEEAAGMIEQARIYVDEAHAALERIASEETGDPERLAAVNQRLELALDLARKHRVAPDELVALTARLGVRLDTLEHQGERRDELELAVQQAADQWLEAAGLLGTQRRQAASRLAQRGVECLAELGMPQARLMFEVTAVDPAQPSRHGGDQVAITFSANPGQSPKPLARVASGGELSRVALALMIATGVDDQPLTRVFDEVDAGVGGPTAQAVGRFLHQVAEGGQAFCVTHLPQVAARADHQIRVIKRIDGERTRTEAERLDAQQRQREIARMLGGVESEASLAHASEMLQSP